MQDTQASAKIIELKNHALIRVSGADALTFLQGQLTADIREVTETEHRLAAHCNTKGRIVNLYRVFKKQDFFYLQLPHSLLEKSLETLLKYAKFSKANIQDVSENITQIGIINADQNDISNFALEHPEDFHKLNFLSFNSRHLTEMKGNSNTQINYLVLGPDESIQTFLTRTYPNAPCLPPAAWTLFEIRSNIPNIYPETSETFLPHHLNLPALQAVSFKKGCYLGQEIIARMEHLGQIKKQMRQAKILKPDAPTTTLPPPGTEIFSESTPSSSPLGKIITIAPSTEADLWGECLIEMPISIGNQNYFVPISANSDNASFAAVQL